MSSSFWVCFGDSVSLFFEPLSQRLPILGVAVVADAVHDAA